MRYDSGSSGGYHDLRYFAFRQYHEYRSAGTVGHNEAPNRMLFLAAVTRTLTQLKDVDGILFTMNGEALTDESGNMMGVLRSASFVDNAVDNPEDTGRR